MLNKIHNHETFKIKTHSSSKNFKQLHKLKNTKFHHTYGRTSSAINLPRMKYDKEISDSNFYSSTGFSINKNKKKDTSNLKRFNSLLNIQSIEDFLGKTKDPLEKQKELYENIKEEKLKIKNVLSNLISWDNEPTLKEIESFKLINLQEQNKNSNNLQELNKKKNSKTIDNEYEIIKKLKLQKSIRENNAIGEAFKLIKNKVPSQIMKEINISKGTQIKEKNFQLTKLKFSVFDKDYDPSKYKPVVRKEKDKKKEEEEKINKFKEKDYIIQFQKQQRQIEMVRRDEIAVVYKNIIINKLKKKKFIEVLDQTYRLLDKARTEYSLSVDILKDRIKSVQKYYNAFIVSVDAKAIDTKKSMHIKNSLFSNSHMDSETELSKRSKIKKTGLDIYEEKIKKYREYLMIVEDINKEIKNYDDKFDLIQSDLDSLLKISSDKIDQLTISTRQLKYIFKELNNQQTQYYLNILKKGTDTRTEGLSWVVKRLMELNIPIDNSIFPGYLDQEQIDYIIQISKLGFESAQLKQILEALRNRQTGIKLKKKYFCGFLEKETEKYTKKFEGIKVFNLDINNIDDFFKDDVCNSFKSLNKLKDSNTLNYHKNKFDYKSKALQNIIENIQIKSIVENLKQQITKYSQGEGSLVRKDRGKNNIINYLLAQDKNKDYFKDVIILSERIQKLSDFIKKMRKEEFLIFEEKFKYGDLKDERSKNFYDKVFNALFGSSSLEFSGFQKSNL